MPNSFYNYLEFRANQKTSAKTPTIKIKTAPQEPSLALILLPNGHQVSFDGQPYVIKDQHISVFSNYTDFSLFNDYHYTATLKGAAGVINFHVYYTMDGNVAGSSIKKKSSHISAINLANSFCTRVIQNLQNEQAQYLTQQTQFLHSQIRPIPSDPVALAQAIKEAQVWLKKASLLAHISDSNMVLKKFKEYHDSLDWALADVTNNPGRPDLHIIAAATSQQSQAAPVQESAPASPIAILPPHLPSKYVLPPKSPVASTIVQGNNHFSSANSFFKWGGLDSVNRILQDLDDVGLPASRLANQAYAAYQRQFYKPVVGNSLAATVAASSVSSHS